MDKRVLVIEDEDGFNVEFVLYDAKTRGIEVRSLPGKLLAEHDLSTVGGINDMAATLLSANEKNQSITVLIVEVKK